jgi:phosphosulfolactate phosphohydrolase-like enzyme
MCVDMICSIETIMTTLKAGGNVLLPIDTAGRVLGKSLRLLIKNFANLVCGNCRAVAAARSTLDIL